MLYILLLLISCSEIDGSSSLKNKEDLFVKAKEESWDRVLNSSIYSINSINEEDGNTLLHYAAMQNNVEAIENLLKKGAENKYNNDGNLPIHVAVIEGNNEALVKFLENNSIESSNKAGDKLIHLAINDNNLSAVNTLKSKNVNLSSLDSEGNLPIHLAVMNDNLDIVKVLIGDYAYPSGGKDLLTYINEKKGYNALHLATELKSSAIFSLFVDRLIVNNAQYLADLTKDIFARDSKGRNFINIALASGHTDELEVLFGEYGGAPYSLRIRTIITFTENDDNVGIIKNIDVDGNNAFHYAAKYSNSSTIEYLKGFVGLHSVTLENVNTSLNHKNNDGRTPKELAIYLGRPENVINSLDDAE